MPSDNIKDEALGIRKSEATLINHYFSNERIKMNRRKNFIDTVSHIEPEELILDLGGNPLSGMEGKSIPNMLEFLGYGPVKAQPELPFGMVARIDDRILEYLDIDTRSVGQILMPAVSGYKRISETEYFDAWGIKRKFNGMYWDIAANPLRNATAADLSDYIWPDGNTLDERHLESIRDKAKHLYENTDYVICAEHPVYGVFELGCWLCGFDDFLVKMLIDEDFVKELFDRILKYQQAVIEQYYSAVGEYIHYTSSGDDFATQNGLFVSPETFGRLIKPYLSERIRITKKYTSAKFLHHSCGSVYRIIDQLMDCGVDILNPIQPEASDMRPEKLKSEFGDRIVFHGGLGTQHELVSGTEESIEQYVKNVISLMNTDGGYILAAAHNIQEDVPPENIIHMFKAARKYGKSASES